MHMLSDAGRNTVIMVGTSWYVCIVFSLLFRRKKDSEEHKAGEERRQVDQDVDRDVLKQIDKDVLRTDRAHPYYRGEEGIRHVGKLK